MNNKVLHQISYGMYVVSSKQKDKINGQIVNAVMQITSEPATIAVSINKQNLTHQYILESKAFSVSILQEETPLTFIGKFGFKSGRNIDKFQGTNYIVSPCGIPIVTDYTLSYLECEVINNIDAGTHSIFIAKIIGAEIVKEGTPMTYEYYHKVKNGTSPQSAPTYIKDESKMKTK